MLKNCMLPTYSRRTSQYNVNMQKNAMLEVKAQNMFR